MKKSPWLLFSFFLILLMSCDEQQFFTKPNHLTIPNYYDKEAYEYLDTFLNASPATIRKLSTSLRPTDKDIKIVFQDTSSQRKVRAYISKVYDKEKFKILCRKEHTVLKVSSARVRDFLRNRPIALTFPSDFMEVVPLVYDDLTFHRFKFVAEGNEVGAAYDGLVKIRDRWVLFPKVWRAFEN